MDDCAPTLVASRGAVMTLQSFEVAVLSRRHSLRREAELLIESVYAKSFNVEVHTHFPTLIAVLDRAGRIGAAAGCRRASDEPLFLEQYLSEPIECALGRAGGANVTRSDIGEIGNLATSGAGAAVLFSALASHLVEIGVTYAVATATRRLRRAFATFGFGAGEIAAAQPSRLRNGGCEWGRYFEHDPVVVWGRVAAGLRQSELGGQR